MAAAPAKARFADRWLLSRPRLAASVAAAVAAAFALRPDHAATRWLCAWNVGTWLYIVLAVVMMARSDDRAIRSRAAGTDDGKWAILVLTVLAAACAMGAILVEIAIAKDLKGPLRGLHLGLAGLTLVSAWVFIHLTFALHYAHEYFDEHKGREGETRRLRGGLRFPETTDPDYWDFLYFSFIIGVATQTADVEISSKAMRRTSLAHSVLAFFFNSAVLALTINIAAGLV